MNEDLVQIDDTRYWAGRDGSVIGPRGKLKPWVGDSRGHLKVELPGRRRLFVHRIVARAFIGPCPPDQEVRHINGDPTDNRVENLAYGTRSQNVLDAVKHGTYRNANGEKTHCVHGHAFDTANTYVDPAGHRRCRTCRKDGVH